MPGFTRVAKIYEIENVVMSIALGLVGIALVALGLADLFNVGATPQAPGSPWSWGKTFGLLLGAGMVIAAYLARTKGKS